MLITLERPYQQRDASFPGMNFCGENMMNTSVCWYYCILS